MIEIVAHRRYPVTDLPEDRQALAEAWRKGRYSIDRGTAETLIRMKTAVAGAAPPLVA